MCVCMRACVCVCVCVHVCLHVCVCHRPLRKDSVTSPEQAGLSVSYRQRLPCATSLWRSRGEFSLCSPSCLALQRQCQPFRHHKPTQTTNPCGSQRPAREREAAVDTTVCFPSPDLWDAAGPFSSRFMSTCPGEHITYYLHGSLNLSQR